MLWDCRTDNEGFSYFLAPSVLFFSLIWLPWHFLHLVVEMGFLAPHLKHILKNNLRCCAICFFATSVMGIYTVLDSMEGSFLPFCSYYFTGMYKTIRFFLLLSYYCLCIADVTNIIGHFWLVLALPNSIKPLSLLCSNKSICQFRFLVFISFSLRVIIQDSINRKIRGIQKDD